MRFVYSLMQQKLPAAIMMHIQKKAISLSGSANGTYSNIVPVPVIQAKNNAMNPPNKKRILFLIVLSIVLSFLLMLYSTNITIIIDNPKLF